MKAPRTWFSTSLRGDARSLRRRFAVLFHPGVRRGRVLLLLLALVVALSGGLVACQTATKTERLCRERFEAALAGTRHLVSGDHPDHTGDTFQDADGQTWYHCTHYASQEELWNALGEVFTGGYLQAFSNLEGCFQDREDGLWCAVLSLYDVSPWLSEDTADLDTLQVLSQEGDRIVFTMDCSATAGQPVPNYFALEQSDGVWRFSACFSEEDVRGVLSEETVLAAFRTGEGEEAQELTDTVAERLPLDGQTLAVVRSEGPHVHGLGALEVGTVDNTTGTLTAPLFYVGADEFQYQLRSGDGWAEVRYTAWQMYQGILYPQAGVLLWDGSVWQRIWPDVGNEWYLSYWVGRTAELGDDGFSLYATDENGSSTGELLTTVSNEELALLREGALYSRDLDISPTVRAAIQDALASGPIRLTAITPAGAYSGLEVYQVDWEMYANDAWQSMSIADTPWYAFFDGQETLLDVRTSAPEALEETALAVRWGLTDPEYALTDETQSTWYGLTGPAELDELLGGAPTVEALPYEVDQPGSHWERRSWEGLSLECLVHADGTSWLYRLETTRPDLFTRRGAHVGIPRAEVLALYPAASSGSPWDWDETAGKNLWVGPDTIPGFYLGFQMENGRVAAIRLLNFYD